MPLVIFTTKRFLGDIQFEEQQLTTLCSLFRFILQLSMRD